MKNRALTLAPSEAEAIERAKQGDEEAFALLYGLHKGRSYFALVFVLRLTRRKPRI